MQSRGFFCFAVASIALVTASCGDDSESTEDTATDTDATDVSGDTEETNADATVDTPVADTNPADIPSGEPPVIRSIDPTSGSTIGRFQVAVFGENFDRTCTALIGAVEPLSIVVVDSTTLDLTFPGQDQPGPVDLTLTCHGETTVAEGIFTYFAPEIPTVTSVSPDFGSSAGGTVVTLTGENLVESGRVLIAFSGALATDIEFVDENTVTCVTPATAAGEAAITFDIDGQRVAVGESFIFLDPLAIDEITPAAGDRAGGTEVSLRGAGFGEFAGLTISLGTEVVDPATYDFIAGGSRMTFEAPATDQTGVVDVVVTSLAESVTLEDAFAWVDPIRLTGLSPDAVPTGGVERITISGTGFDTEVDPLLVFVGSTEAFDVTVDSSTEISFLMPEVDAGRYPVQLHHGLEIVNVPEPIDVFELIVVDSLSPTTGPLEGGTRVEVLGTGFSSSAIVLFGENLGADVAVASSGESLTVTTPAGVGTVDVTVRSPFTSDVLVGGFTYEAATP